MSLQAFRFDHVEHEYWDSRTGEQIPHITGMLLRSGWVSDEWYTEESRIRGSAVHRLTTNHDLGALNLGDVPDEYRGYVLGYVAAMGVLKPVWTDVEVALVHPTLRFGGRPDRLGKLLGSRAVMEIKTGPAERGHAVQTALQAILAAGEGGLPAEFYARYALYLKPSGRYKLERFVSRKDLDHAYQVIKEYCS